VAEKLPSSIIDWIIRQTSNMRYSVLDDLIRSRAFKGHFCSKATYARDTCKLSHLDMQLRDYVSVVQIIKIRGEECRHNAMMMVY
jgi:hypothetical protein